MVSRNPANKFIETADSISMCCEASSTGKPLYIAGIDAPHLRTDHRRFVETFIQHGYAEPLTHDVIDWQSKPRPEPLNTAADIAKLAKQLYCENIKNMMRLVGVGAN